MLSLLFKIEAVPSNVFVTTILVLLLMILWQTRRNDKRASKPYPPSPSRLPIIGHMHHLRKYADNPWDGFDSLRKKFGNFVQLQLGQHNFALVSSPALMREILISKGELFANRPHFDRYKCVFGGDQENALALCDWSELQKIRRHIAQMFIIPRYGTALHNSLDRCIQVEIVEMMEELEHSLTKMDLLVSIFNMFTDYLCSKRFDKTDSKFRQQAINYDIVFYDINQCYPFDFLPWLSCLPSFRKQLEHLRTVCKSIADYVEAEMVLPRNERIKQRLLMQDKQEPKNENLSEFILTQENSIHNLRKPNVNHSNERPEDFLEYNLQHHHEQPDKYSWYSALYEVGDVVGGNSAVANLAMRLLGFLALNPKCQLEIVQEARDALQFEREHVCEHVQDQSSQEDGLPTQISLKHRPLMPYLEACIMEVLRLTSSPIVPHVASENTSVGGYFVEKGTNIMFNCYHLNLDEKYYNDPRRFDPMRFLVPSGDRNNNPTAKNDEQMNSSTGNVSTNPGLSVCPFSNGIHGGTKTSSWGACVTGVQPTIRYQTHKPDNYFPFSWGKRSCLGYKMVQTIIFSLVANLVLKYELKPRDEKMRILMEHQLISKGCLALPVENCFELCLQVREEPQTL